MYADKDMGRYARRGFRVYGVVQGVGFRPFIYQLALRYNLNGWVRNTSGCVEIEIEGPKEAIDAFAGEILRKAPAAARVQRVESRVLPLTGEDGFRIVDSLPRAGEYQLISPDLATCADCQREIFDPADRRYRYPFTNCTNCGPRFTIIKDIPYDRPRTTMGSFTMCPDCRREYDDPSNRRFHAQPNACPACGPGLRLVDGNGWEITGDPLTEAGKLLRAGEILAVKGLGGFLLACDATSEKTLALLRGRKHRPSRPFAVMLRDLEAASRYCVISPEEEALLASPAGPIVLLKMKEDAPIAPATAPGLKYLGLILPYTPLHHLLIREVEFPLVMTSGNISEEPISRDNDEALRRLKGIAGYFLLHDRDIFVRYDDSVVMQAAGETRMVRRARGYAPHPLSLAFDTPGVLACGAELKSAFCLTRDRHAFLSQHIGDLENSETLACYEQTVEVYQRLFHIEPLVVACDLHPDYLSTHYARERAAASPGLQVVPVQHHHAHIAALLAEHGEEGPAIGVAFDGTGYGTDGAIWGGEFLLADLKDFQRLAHLEYVPLPGGDTATRRPDRIAAAYVYYLLGESSLTELLPAIGLSGEEAGIVKIQVDRLLNAPRTSSAGRLFDAVSALLGIRQAIDYEAQAAIELEMAATGSKLSDPVVYQTLIESGEGPAIIRLAPLFRAIISDINSGVRKDEIAYRFHRSVARTITRVCTRLKSKTGINTIGLSGGCFQNRLLTELTVTALRDEGFRVLTHSLVPTNDGGVALGQAAVAAHVAAPGANK